MKVRTVLWAFIVVLVTVPLMFNVAQAGNEAGEKAYEAGDYKTAHKAYLAEAQKGDSEAQGWCGYMYLLGKGVSKDLGEALKWYRKGADQGDNLALNGLGYMYQYGKGVSKDLQEAVKFYGKAAEQGYPKSQSNFGLMLAQGKGVKKDGVLAYMWLHLASTGGYQKADKWLKKVGKKLTPAQIEEAKKKAGAWTEK
jgi:TPR repeat protein